MTERLYYSDCYLRAFDAQVIDSAEEGCRVYLDRTAFYPTSGGQPHDLGTLAGVAVVDVVDEEDRVAHVLAQPLSVSSVCGEVDWGRRYDLMQQHSGQHLLSAVLEELFGYKTVSVHMGTSANTVDIEIPGISEQQLAEAEDRCAEIVAQARPTAITFEDSAAGLRKESSRAGTLRIVSIEGIDRSACGGTHIRNSAEIGPVMTGKTEKIRGITRIEFVCGQRALRRARADRQLLASISRTISLPAEQAPERFAALVEQNKALEKERLRLATEQAQREGSELYWSTAPDAAGLRRAIQRGTIDDAMRHRAQAFAANEQAVFLAISEGPPSVLLACSADSGVHAGNRVKAAVSEAGGRGGGNATLAQGSVPDTDSLERVVALLQQGT